MHIFTHTPGVLNQPHTHMQFPYPRSPSPSWHPFLSCSLGKLPALPSLSLPFFFFALDLFFLFLHAPRQASHSCMNWAEWLRDLLRCCCSQTTLSAAEFSHSSDGRAGQVDWGGTGKPSSSPVWDILNKSRQKKKEIKKEEESTAFRSLVHPSPPSFYSFFHMHTQWHPSPLPIIPSLCPILLWTVEHPRLSCMEAQGGAGSPGKSHFIFFLF